MQKNNLHGKANDAAFSERELRHAAIARKLAAEGMVLLKNETILPLDPSQPIGLFGAGAVQTVKGGLGSGDVNNRRSISIYEGLLEAGAPIVSRAWLEDYRSRYDNARNSWKDRVLEAAKDVENPFDAYVANPFVRPEGRALTDEDVKGAKTLVYVLSRISGEGNDRRLEAGDYFISEQEREDLLFLDRQSLPIVLIMNTGGVVELTELLEKASNIRAVLSVSQPGQEGGHALADVLFGRAAPGGRLTATWARHYEDYPFSDSFSYLNKDLEKEEYKEGIFVGYRYFDTYGVKPLFPFGYGLTYTTFALAFEKLQRVEGGFRFSVAVTNTGKREGREVVQLYMTPPEGSDAKEHRRLIGFAKTGLLAPGEMEQVTIYVPRKQLASFDGKAHAWYLDGGSYLIWCGKHVEDLQLCARLVVNARTVIEQDTAICQKTRRFEELGETEKNRAPGENYLESVETDAVQTFLFLPEQELRPRVKKPMKPLQPVEDLIPLLYGALPQDGQISGVAEVGDAHESGEMQGVTDQNVGTASVEVSKNGDAPKAGMLGVAGIRVPGSAGETTRALEAAYGIPSLALADGPAGLRLQQSYEVDRETGSVYGAGVLRMLENGFLEPGEHHEGADTYYQFCTAFPVGTALAQTWDTGLMREFGEAIGDEMQEFGVDLWLAPGMNIQRNPLCGRNFEYYSEDPLVSGLMAAAVTEGVQSRSGCGVTIKHFACNNQEDNRMGVDSCLSERALREIYVRGFEIAVKQASPLAIMTSYNKVNGVQAANSKDLCTVLARGEWGFDGTIMSDWSTTAPEDGSIPWKCVSAGNDIIMPGSPKDAENIRAAYRDGLLSEQEIRDCAGRVLALIQKLKNGSNS